MYACTCTYRYVGSCMLYTDKQTLMYVCIKIHICIDTYIPTSPYTNIDACLPTYLHAYNIYASIHSYIPICMYTYILIYGCLHIHKQHTCISLCMFGYMYAYVTEVNINVAGMNTFLFPMEFLHFGRKIPSLLHF